MQVLRESGIEVAGEDDREILAKDSEIRRWKHIPVSDEPQETINQVTRKLSVISASGKSVGSPKARDGMTMGMKMDQKAEAELPVLSI